MSLKYCGWWSINHLFNLATCFFLFLVQNITKVSVSGRPPAIITGILWQLNFIIEWLQSYALYTGAHDIICINFDFPPSSWGCFYHQRCSCCSFGVRFSHSMSSRLLCCLVCCPAAELLIVGPWGAKEPLKWRARWCCQENNAIVNLSTWGHSCPPRDTKRCEMEAKDRKWIETLEPTPSAKSW